MRLRYWVSSRVWLMLVVAALLAMTAGAVRAAEMPAAPGGSGWLERAALQVEQEVASDITALPAIPDALAREWRSFDRNGSAGGTFLNIGWIAIAAIVALLAERAVSANLASRRARRRLQARTDGPHLVDLLGLVLADLAGLAAFYAVFAAAQRHFLPGVRRSRRVFRRCFPRTLF